MSQTLQPQKRKIEYMANLPLPASVPILHDDSSEGSTQPVVSVKFYEHFQQ